MQDEEDDYNKEMDEKAHYEAQLEAEGYAREESEWEAQMEHEKEVIDSPLKTIIEAIIEREEKGQLCPQTITDLKVLLNAVNVAKEI